LNKSKASGMHAAARNGNLSCVTKLQEKGCNVDYQDVHGSTALHYASQCGFPAICKFLLSKGAKAKLKNKDGKTAKDLARTPELIAAFEACE